MALTPLTRLIQELAKMPGVGERTAERLAFYILGLSAEEAKNLCNAIHEVKHLVKSCPVCYNISDREPCEICTSVTRDQAFLCAVEQPKDLWAIEKTGMYKGLYHVLRGVIAPLDGVGVEDLTIAKLVERVKSGSFQELIVGTSPTSEGEATAYYIQKQLKGARVKVTRLAKGIPSGTSLDYVSKLTLSDALAGRREF